MIYLYAIIEPMADAPVCAGFDEAPVRLARGSSISGLYSSHDRVDPAVEPETLWRHEQVVEAAMRHGPTLPVRFGTTFADSDALAAALERGGERLHRQLERVRGCVELAVRVGVVDGDEPQPGDGRGYVQARLARDRRQRAAAERTLAPLAELAVSARSSESRSQREVICGSYLVPEHAVERFADEVRLLQRQNPELALSCTGPWPPYSFVEVEEAA